jgi:hypothetical protein
MLFSLNYKLISIQEKDPKENIKKDKYLFILNTIHYDYNLKYNFKGNLASHSFLFFLLYFQKCQQN